MIAIHLFKQLVQPKVLLALFLGLCLGWLANSSLDSKSSATAQTPLRSGGNKLIKPLLLCNSNFQNDSKSLISIRNSIQQYIDDSNASGNTAKISVYFRYLNSGEEFNINKDEQFFPASIQKLMMMMRLYKMSEANPELLTAEKDFPSFPDSNTNTVIPPLQSPKPGQKYTADQLIEYMIKYSDNNSFDVLYSSIGEAEYQKIFTELQLQYPESTSTDQDYITAYQISLFFRMLYSATYLSDQNSEKALNLLTQTDYRNGLVKNLPANISVAHKFGVAAVQDNDGRVYGQLHDCGIIYKSDNPYVLCVMTKSSSTDISAVEDAIAKISAIAYQNAH